MRALLVLALLLPVGIASSEVSHPLIATMYRWSGEPMTPQQAVAWLVAGGNPTVISAPPDIEAKPLHFASGTYWEAIEAVCRTFDLEVAPAIRHLQAPYQNEVGPRYHLDLGLGPVLLRQRDPQSQASNGLYHNGPVLMELVDTGIFTRTAVLPKKEQPTHRLGLLATWRLEPRFSADSLGAAVVNWHLASASNGRRLSWLGDGEPPPRDRLMMDPMASTPNREESPPIPEQMALWGIRTTDLGIDLEGTVTIQRLQTRRYEDISMDPLGFIDVEDERWMYQAPRPNNPFNRRTFTLVGDDRLFAAELHIHSGNTVSKLKRSSRPTQNRDGRTIQFNLPVRKPSESVDLILHLRGPRPQVPLTLSIPLRH